MQSSLNSVRRTFHFRALITLVTTVLFCLMALSGVMLYLAPRGRVANWTDWSLLGLEKEQWSDLHMTTAVLLLVVIGVHVYLNWRPLIHYLESRSARHGMRLRELVVAFAVAAAIVVGTLGGLPPFSAVLTANEAIKEAWESRAGTVGRAPSTLVQEGSVREFAGRMGLSLERLQDALRAHGIEADDLDVSIDALVRQHGVSLRSIYEAASSNAERDGQAHEREGRGERRDGGGQFGRMTLGEFCRSAAIPLSEAVRALKALDIDATRESRLRDLAGRLDMTPRQLAEWLKQNI